MRCDHCGADISDEALTCDKCGRAVGDEQRATTQDDDVQAAEGASDDAKPDRDYGHDGDAGPDDAERDGDAVPDNGKPDPKREVEPDGEHDLDPERKDAFEIPPVSTSKSWTTVNPPSRPEAPKLERITVIALAIIGAAVAVLILIGAWRFILSLLG